MIRRPPRSTLFPSRRSSDLTVDSWNSDPDNNPATAAVPYSFTAGNAANHAAVVAGRDDGTHGVVITDRKSTRLNSSHSQISYAVFCLKKKNKNKQEHTPPQI